MGYVFHETVKCLSLNILYTLWMNKIWIYEICIFTFYTAFQLKLPLISIRELTKIERNYSQWHLCLTVVKQGELIVDVSTWIWVHLRRPQAAGGKWVLPVWLRLAAGDCWQSLWNQLLKPQACRTKEQSVLDFADKSVCSMQTSSW